MGDEKEMGEMIERRKHSSPWSVEGLAHRVSQLEALAETQAKQMERFLHQFSIMEVRMDRSFEMHAAQTQVNTELLTSIKDMTKGMGEMKEMFAAYEKVKSTGVVIKFIGDSLKWVIGIALAVAAFATMYAKGLPWG